MHIKGLGKIKASNLTIHAGTLILNDLGKILADYNSKKCIIGDAPSNQGYTESYVT